MSCESECRSSQVASHSNQIVDGFRKGSRISYSRDFLLSLANANNTKELPSGFDRSILSELDDSASEYRQPPGLESPCNGRKPGDSSIGSSEKWGRCKLRSTDSKSADYRNFHSNQSPHSKNPGKTATLRSFPNPEHDGILGSWSASKLPSAGSEVPTLKLPGTDSCLLSRCKEPYRPPSFYKAMYSGEQNHNTLSNETSGCGRWPSKERALEKNWRKDTSQAPEEDSVVPAIINKQNSSPISPAVSKSAESPCSPGEASDKCCADHQPLLQDVVVQQLPSNTQLLEKDSEVEVDVEKFDGQIMEGGKFSALINLKEAEDIDSYFLDEANAVSNGSSRDGQSVKEANVRNKKIEKKELKNHVDNSCKSKETRIGDTLHVNATGKTASRSSAVDVPISSASSAGPSYRSSLQSASVDQNWKGINATAKDVHKMCASVPVGPDHSKLRSKSFDGSSPEIWQSSPCTKNYGNIVDGRSSSRSNSRFMHWFPDNDTSHSTVISSGADKDGWKLWGVSSGKSISNHVSQGKPRGPLTHGQKAQFSKSTQKNASEVSSNCAMRNTYSSDGISHHAPNVQEPELDNIARRNQDHRTSGEMSDSLIVDEADNSLEINLPDEDSLNAVDDTYILKQDKPAQSAGFSFRGARNKPFSVSNRLIGSEVIRQNLSSPEPCFHESQLNSWNSPDSLAPDFSFKGAKSATPFPGSNKLIGSEIIKQNLSLPDPWFHESPLNSWNNSDSLAHVNAPTTCYDPWKIHHDCHNPSPAVPSPPGLAPLKPQNIEPSVKDFLLPRTPQADDYCPELDKILSAEPSVYDQLIQTPCCNQAIVNSNMDGGKGGLFAEERNMFTINQYLHIQRKLAQKNLEAAEKRASSKAASYLFR